MCLGWCLWGQLGVVRFGCWLEASVTIWIGKQLRFGNPPLTGSWKFLTSMWNGSARAVGVTWLVAYGGLSSAGPNSYTRPNL